LRTISLSAMRALTRTLLAGTLVTATPVADIVMEKKHTRTIVHCLTGQMSLVS